MSSSAHLDTARQGLRKLFGRSSSVTPQERALLTHDWDRMARHRTPNTDAGRMALVLHAIHAGDTATALEAIPDNPGDVMRYLSDYARWQSGTLMSARGEEFASAFASLHQDDVVTIATIQKSGTHWMRFFLTNYARCLDNPGEDRPISYKELLRDYYGNNRWQFFREAEPYRVPSGLLAGHGISDVTMQHFSGQFDPFVFSPGKKIMLYRNPLDYVISLFHYTIKQRPQNRGRAEHPRDVIVSMLDTYSKHYLTLDAYRDDETTFVAAYEDLKEDPAGRFRDVVRFLGLPLEEEAVDRALALSDISTIHAMEDKAGRSMVVKLDGYFTRDGSIGQWKQFFDDKDVAVAASVLDGYGIDLETFTVEG
ncbi:sulfotransferase domain-containing protein [Myceligenerans indicum]|uniref:Sulfotransferase domain-containing protein n=1 Tax=Myceligenerans indicum TaxID=2593663 RepID=A0ABS1LI06_9MICO|nr:sulfotransferase domain-containing protein [Myceligenerans indicum]MBL0885867.1 sulfotransferase domain-containing protein [Myceligenerans indicum]